MDNQLLVIDMANQVVSIQDQEQNSVPKHRGVLSEPLAINLNDKGANYEPSNGQRSWSWSQTTKTIKRG